MEQVIASTSIVCERPNGERFQVALQIGMPYDVRDGQGRAYARCPVAVAGLHDELSDIAGEDTFQALALALKMCRHLLNHFIDSGGRVFYEDGQSAFDLNATFGVS